MTDSWLLSLRDALWLYGVLPVLALVGVWLTVRLRAPQLTRLADAWKAVRHNGDKDEGATPVAASLLLTTTLSQSTAALVGAATSIALSGPGALAWLWLAAFLFAPIRVGEALLARTNPPGQSTGSAPTSFAARLLAEKRKGLGYLTVGLVGVVALGFAGASNGHAMRAVVIGIAPEALLPVAIGIAVLSLGVALAGAKRVGEIVGWLALLAFAVIFVVSLITAFAAPGRAFGALARVVRDAIEGAPTMGAFAGALAGEIARTTLLRAVLPLVTDAGSSGAMLAMAKAPARQVAAAALLPSLFAAVLGTCLTLALVGSGAATEARETARPLSELVAYEVAFETPSQRLESDRMRNGPMRVRAGELRDTSLVLATERGVIENPHFTYYGAPADLAISFENGRVAHLARYQGLALGEVPVTQAREVMVQGTMLLDGGTLLTRTFAGHAARSVPAQLVFAALLILVLLSSTTFAITAAETAKSVGAPRSVGAAFAALPAIGILLAVALRVPYLNTAGEVAGGLLAVVVAATVYARSGEIHKRLQ